VIPCNRLDVYEEGLRQLMRYSQETGARGRFILLYLGLRRMRQSLATLGSGEATLSSEIETFMDSMLTKTHRSEPYVVLTAPFGGSTSPTAPYSARSGTVAGAQKYPTNTWRNNMGIQKGVGCVAKPEIIRSVLDNPEGRLSCPHMLKETDTGGLTCALTGTRYRGEIHSIWLRVTDDGYQVADLEHPAVYRPYLQPGGRRIPVFPLIAALYCFAPPSTYEPRPSVGLPEFCRDFGFSLDTVEEMFDCDPAAVGNAETIATASGECLTEESVTSRSEHGSNVKDKSGAELPTYSQAGVLNTGVGAEVAVANLFASRGWNVTYFGNTPGVGYDLVVRKGNQEFKVEVKSSVGMCSPVLTETEWEAALRFGPSYVVVAVDFCGSPTPSMRYLVDPAGTCEPLVQQTTAYKLRRGDFTKEPPAGLAPV